MDERTHEVRCPSGLTGLMREILVKDVNALASRKGKTSGVDSIGRMLAGLWKRTLDVGPYGGLPTVVQPGQGIAQWEQILVGDRSFLLLEARRLTYGDDFYFTVKCRCRAKIEWHLKLPELKVKGLSSVATRALEEAGLDAVIPIHLPIADRDVSIRMLQGRHQMLVSNAADKGEDEMNIAGLLVRLAGISGASTPGERRDFVQNLHIRDLDVLRKAWEEHDLSVQDTISIECPKCGHEQEVNIPIDDRFFSVRSATPPSTPEESAV